MPLITVFLKISNHIYRKHTVTVFYALYKRKFLSVWIVCGLHATFYCHDGKRHCLHTDETCVLSKVVIVNNYHIIFVYICFPCRKHYRNFG